MKTATIPYILTVCYLIRLFEAAIISSNKVNINDIPHCTTKLYQLLFGAYNALDADGEILFDYGDNEVYAISKIANGKQNVGRKYRNLILYGECGDISIEPISPEKIQYIFDNYMTRSEVVHILKTIKEVLIYDSLVNVNPYLNLLSNKKEAEFIYKALVEVAIYADVKKSDINNILASARLCRTKMSEVQRNAYDFAIDALHSDENNRFK